MRRLPLLFCVILLGLSANVLAQQTIVAASRSIDWTHAGAGTLPARLTQCGSTIGAYTGTAATINTAANDPACAGKFIHLGPGEFHLSTGIRLTTNNITLRGDGPDQTKIFFSGPDTSCLQPADVCIEGSSNGSWEGGPQHLTTWNEQFPSCEPPAECPFFPKGLTQAVVGSTAGLTVGQLVILDQANDVLDTNHVFVCDNTVNDQSHTGCSADTSFGSPGRTVSGVDYNQQQYVVVTAIEPINRLVTFTPGLYMPNWGPASDKNPGMWWATTVVTGIGIENLSMDHTGSTGAFSGVMIDNATKSWMKNVRSIYIEGGAAEGRNHVWVQYASALTIRDSYFYGTISASSLSYGVEPWQSGDLLIENNIFQHVASPVIASCPGCVIGYNYSTDDFNGNATFMFPSLWTHDAGDDMALWEGNEGAGLIQDALHGSHNFATVFRNFFSGREGNKSQQTVPIILQSHSRYANVVGNVLGTPGYHDVHNPGPTQASYEARYPSMTNCDRSIYNLGWSGSSCTSDTVVPSDPITATTLMRWGNYDVFNAAVQWNTNEVPSGLTDGFANPVPPDHVLPSSFYLASAPSFFATFYGTVPYPPIGPDVTGGNISGYNGFANHVPAQKCYSQMGDDDDLLRYPAGTVRTFNATTCYP